MSVDQPSSDDAPHSGLAGRDREAIMAELEELLVHGGAGVVAIDLDGVITHWSAGAQRLYGWSADEAIGRPVLDLLIAPAERTIAHDHFDIIRSAGSWEGQFAIRCKNGGVVYAYIRSALIKDDAGRPVGVIGLSMDVSPPL